MHAKHGRRAGLPVHLREEAHAVLANGRNLAKLSKQIHELGMIVRQTSGADVRPELRLFRADYVHAEIPVLLRCRLFEWQVENATGLYRFVTAGTKQFQRIDPRERADLVLHGSAAIQEIPL